MNPPVFSLEDQLKARIFRDRVKELELTEMKTLLVEMFQQMLVNDNKYQQAIAQQWGIIDKKEE